MDKLWHGATTVEHEHSTFAISTPCRAERIVWKNSDTHATTITEHTLHLAEEVPLALVYNSIEYAVMMVTPHSIIDFAIGFSMTEGIIKNISEIRNISISPVPGGLKADLRISADALRTVLARSRRPIAGRTSCGICGADMNSVVTRVQNTVQAYTPDLSAIRSALACLRDHQTLNAGIGMLHAAAWCDTNGNITSIREDVGRHNALDKLIGHGLQTSKDFTDGFCLITSRCSYEMASKAIAAGTRMLVSLSAPTAYALRTAQQAGLTLVSPARADNICILPSIPQNT
ncbi:formate dehydrogenase accessory sulfurtransferase FdhD [Acetobacter lambici]|uniref:Sulfur carrier protein FdhD n=1 Tax=Acetobacter lambici TaxID=1332824 RepID=A0ABT1F3H0_9PROT|nr:formate dehydrogenase accessory sulfurtransferase FdhD [Acetobacter lambici]MCP1243527.1 formate dehydrogenase accessory sulfurtransferase FdhD [Acetobacter lambici]MCP1259546.1 formate dehydrogenase accessory sulfurtransferase FdhD [Acetobacter lambici]NHO57816.1 formate dehydrogenase accessory sulfurtransferase FdhD [Acetobacter lambici]